MARRTIFTIGHSTRPWREFVDLLKQWEVQQLIDVRTMPRSRAFPRFSKEKMGPALGKAGIDYLHLASLGGLRHPKKDSKNAGWRNASFRGFADYMQTPDFEAGLAELRKVGSKRRVCIMCAEAVWWRCHRRMIADALVARGVPVRHIMTMSSAKEHEVTPFAVVKRRGRKPPLITFP
jgi:uncharacterized protein (DUF488 family)